MSIINVALPHFPPRGGRVINISSLASKTANVDRILVDGASKAALDSITRSPASILGVKTGVTFNSVNMGPTRSGATLAAVESFGQAFCNAAIEPTTAGKRMGEPEDIGFVVGFLASEEARWINAQSIPANGRYKDVLALQG